MSKTQTALTRKPPRKASFFLAATRFASTSRAFKNPLATSFESVPVAAPKSVRSGLTTTRGEHAHLSVEPAH